MSKRIVVTGAAGALGKAVIAALNAAGHDTVGVDIGATAGGPGAFVGGVDLTDEAAARDAFARIAADGVIDGLTNVAGGFTWETVAEGSLQSWQRMFAMNVVTALNACRAALPHLRSGASIVNVGAAAGLLLVVVLRDDAGRRPRQGRALAWAPIPPASPASPA